MSSSFQYTKDISATIENIKSRRHTEQSLVDIVKWHSPLQRKKRGLELTESQKIAFDKHPRQRGQKAAYAVQRIQEKLSNLHEKDSWRPAMKKMNYWYRVFNHFIFLGTLPKLPTSNFRVKMGSLGKGTRAWSNVTRKGDWPVIEKGCIIIQPALRTGRTNILNALVHEMGHQFFDLYAAQQPTIKLHHGKAFQMLMLTINAEYRIPAFRAINLDACENRVSSLVDDIYQLRSAGMSVSFNEIDLHEMEIEFDDLVLRLEYKESLLKARAEAKRSSRQLSTRVQLRTHTPVQEPHTSPSTRRRSQRSATRSSSRDSNARERRTEK